jgi:hypothetical protein
MYSGIITRDDNKASSINLNTELTEQQLKICAPLNKFIGICVFTLWDRTVVGFL